MNVLACCIKKTCIHLNSFCHLLMRWVTWNAKLNAYTLIWSTASSPLALNVGKQLYVEFQSRNHDAQNTIEHVAFVNSDTSWKLLASHNDVQRKTAGRLNSFITSTTLYLQVITTKQTHQWMVGSPVLNRCSGVKKLNNKREREKKKDKVWRIWFNQSF